MSPEFDVCVVGGGPAGLASALRLARAGLSVLLVESGGEAPDAAAQALVEAEILTPTAHCPMSDAVWRGLGGASALWGGRCVPLDGPDFEVRPHVPHSGWPLRAADLDPFMGEATQFLGAGEPHFDVGTCRDLPTAGQPLVPGLDGLEGVLSTTLERWSTATHVWVAHGPAVLGHKGIEVRTGWTCVALTHDAPGAAVCTATLARVAAGKLEQHKVQARAFVLACGGVETTRLVLNAMEAADGLQLAGSAWVGRFYMGHPSGKIADLEFPAPPQQTLYGFERDGGVYVRRRITFSAAALASAGLQNIAFWLDNPPIYDPRHGSGVLSAAYLALSAPVLGSALAPSAIRKRMRGDGPVRLWSHVRNCLRSPVATLGFSARFLHARYRARPRLPGFFTYSPLNRYALHYHAEQAPDPDSRITLASSRDALGLRRASVALHWATRDIDSVIRAHRQLEQAVARERVATMHWRYEERELEQAVHAQALDGFHQMGGLRMASTPEQGVADSYGRLFGTTNLYAATSAIFPTGGQANSTLPMVALVLRQADEIARSLRQGAP